MYNFGTVVCKEGGMVMRIKNRLSSFKTLREVGSGSKKIIILRDERLKILHSVRQTKLYTL